MPTERTAGAGPVLLVDDDDVFVDLVQRHLEAHGYVVATAGSVEAAREVLRTGNRPSLLILDINLPDDSGWSLLRDGSLAGAGSPPVAVCYRRSSPSSVVPRRRIPPSSTRSARRVRRSTLGPCRWRSRSTAASRSTTHVMP